MLDSSWNDALSLALGNIPGITPGMQLFLEAREDLWVEESSSGGRSQAHNRLVGLSATPPDQGLPLVHRSDPAPEDARALLLTALGRTDAPETRVGTSAKVGPGTGKLLEESEAALAATLDPIRRLGSGIGYQARWVGFRQQVRIAVRGAPVVGDLRQSRRLRLEVEVRRRGKAVRAVGEKVLSTHPLNLREALGELATSVADRAQVLLEARPVASGERRVVLGPGIGGILCHELVGHALEADAAAGGSWLKELKEKISFGDLVILDDPRRGRAAWRIDDEGEPARPIPLVRDGRVVSLLHDRSTATAAGARPTGHGRRANYREPVRPRMGCTFIGAGRHDPEEVLEGIDDGIYVLRLESASVDPRSGRAFFRVTDSDRIVRGRRAEPLRPHLMAVDGVRTLSSIDRIARDLAFDNCIGSCHRDGQTMAVSVGAPTIRIGMVRVVA